MYTNSLYQLLSLYEGKKRQGHRLVSAEVRVSGIQPPGIGWYDEDTCESLTIDLKDLNFILGAGGYPLVRENCSPFVREERDKILALCQSNDALWRSTRALLSTPEGRIKFFTAPDPEGD